MKKRIRVAGIIPLNEGFVFIHRTNVADNNIKDYYVFSGGGLEKETLEEGTKREIKEEIGIEVIVKELLYTIENEKNIEYFFLCDYVGGKIGTGDGPEFNGNPQYIHRGNYIPVIIEREKVKDLNLVPYEIKERLVRDIEANRI